MGVEGEALSLCVPTSPLYLNIYLEGFHEPLQPGCAGCTLYLEKAKLQGIFSWFVSCSSCGRSNCLYLHISALCWKSQLCVCGVVGVNSPNPLQGKSNGLAKTEYVNC